MRKVILLAAIFFSFNAMANPGETSFFSLHSPQKKKAKSGFDKSRILLGPGIGVGAAYRAFSFNISPSVAYCITDRFHVGTTIGFNYFQQTFEYTNPLFPAKVEKYKAKLPSYSFSVYARYLIGNFLILNVEPELNNTKFITSDPNNWAYYNQSTGKYVEKSQRRTFGSFLVGGGYYQRMGRYGYGYLMVCYDLVQNPNLRYYATLDYRTGIMIDLWQK